MASKSRRRQKRTQKKKPISVKAGALAGITVLAGGVEPAGAATMQTGVSFDCSLSVADLSSLVGTTLGPTDSTCSGTAPKFDTMGGTRVLNSVTFAVDGSRESFIRATFGGSEEGGSGSGGANATGVYSFTVETHSLDADPGPGTTVTEMAETSCDPTCLDFTSNGINPTFSSTYTDAGILAEFQMDGAGMFDFTPLINLSGSWNCPDCGSVEPSTGIDSEFFGNLNITYDYMTIPLPPVAFLFPAGLMAGIGWMRRRITKAG